MPAALLWAPDAPPNAPPVVSLMRLPICEEHKTDFTEKPLEEIVGGLREKVNAAMAKAGRVAPDWKRTQVTFVPIDMGRMQFVKPEEN